MQRPDNPILNSPFEPPERHWHLDNASVHTAIINQGRRRGEHVVPIAQPKKVTAQHGLDLEIRVTRNELIIEIPGHVERWRALPSVFIVVFQNTSHRKQLYGYIAGYEAKETTPGGDRRTVVVPRGPGFVQQHRTQLQTPQPAENSADRKQRTGQRAALTLTFAPFLATARACRRIGSGRLGRTVTGYKVGSGRLLATRSSSELANGLKTCNSRKNAPLTAKVGSLWIQMPIGSVKC